MLTALVFVFYAATNFGFFSQYHSQVNKELWVDALLQLNTSKKNNFPSPPDQSQSNLSQTSVQDNIIDFSVLPSDTGDVKGRFEEITGDKQEGQIEEKVEGKINLSDTSKVISDSLLSLVDTVKVDSAALDSTAKNEIF